MRSRLIFLFALALGIACAQPPGGPTVFYPIATTALLPAACTGSIGWVVASTAGSGAGNAYTCVAGVPKLTATGGAAGAPGGTNTQIQYNNNGAFGGISQSATGGTSNVVTRDANGNSAANNFINAVSAVSCNGITVPLTAGTPRTTITSNGGGSTQTFTLPDATTLNAGTQFNFNNNCTGSVTVNNNGGTLTASVTSNGTPNSYAQVTLLTNGSANGTWDVHFICPPSGCGGSAAPVHLSFRVLCQNTVAGGSFSIPVTNGASLPACDAAWSNMDGYIAYTNGTTQYALVGPLALDSSFADPVKATVWWNTTATSGTFIPSLAALCVSSGGAITTNWWTTASYSNFASSTAAGTASQVTTTPTLSFTSGCSAGQLLYLSLRWASGSGTLAAAAQVKLLDLTATW